MKFLADGMLGKLTRWLRILGQDVKYSASADDAELINVCKKEHRTLLTRDFELYKQAMAKGIDVLYMEGKTGDEKLAEMAKRFAMDLNINMAVSRCPKCNTRVSLIPKEAISGKVGKNTFEHYDEFWKCRKCGQIYWQGAHWIQIRKTLEKARQKREIV